jgi:hypothetical protein
MRRLALMFGGLALVASFGFTETAGAGIAAPAHVKPGSKWTFEFGAGCEIQTFASGHTFSADMFGDAGTYSGGGKTISETFTSGDAGLTFSGTYSKATKTYTGPIGGITVGVGELVKGSMAGC